jgi:hypothetical protein
LGDLIILGLGSSRRKEVNMAEMKGDAGRLAGQLEEMAHTVYGLPKDDRSQATAKDIAEILQILSEARVEMDEEPILTRLRSSPDSNLKDK